MNTYTKYCPNVWVAQCTETHKKAIRELNRPISIDIDEDDIVNIEPIYKGEKNDYPTTQPTGTHRQGNRLL